MDKLRINFVSQGSSYLASHRMRITKPAELLNVGTENIVATSFVAAILDTDLNIFFKHFAQKENVVSVRDSKDTTFYTAFDVCDDHFDRELGPYYKTMCEHVDYLTCNSQNMAERIFEVTGRNSRVIPDPIMFPFAEPAPLEEISQREPSFMWYGHSSNVNPLLDMLENVPGRVTVICDAHIKHPNVDYIPWKPMVAETNIKNSDIVLIPTTDKDWTKCKSPNRAVDAIQSGKLVVTDNRDIYGDLEDFIFIIDKPEEVNDVVKFWKEEPEEVAKKVKAGQEFIQEKYGDGVVLDSWLDALKDLGLVKEYENVKA